MPLRLRDNLHWCDCLGRAVFLDVAADRYFCLTSILNDAFLRLAIGVRQSGDASLLSALCDYGILVDDPGAPDVPAHLSLEAMTGDYPVDHHPGRRLWSTVGALASEAALSWSLRKRPLLQLISAARNRRSRKWRRPSNMDKSLQAIIGAVKTAAYITRTHDRCLVHGFAVHAACRRAGIDAKLVIGVIANPFAAHCWVQFGHWVLVGEFEHARLYTPILVIE